MPGDHWPLAGKSCGAKRGGGLPPGSLPLPSCGAHSRPVLSVFSGSHTHLGQVPSWGRTQKEIAIALLSFLNSLFVFNFKTLNATHEKQDNGHFFLSTSVLLREYMCAVCCSVVYLQK